MECKKKNNNNCLFNSIICTDAYLKVLSIASVTWCQLLRLSLVPRPHDLGLVPGRGESYVERTSAAAPRAPRNNDDVIMRSGRLASA